MRKSFAMILVVGGLLMVLLPWLESRFYIGPLASATVITRSGDPALFIDLSDILDNCMAFGILTSLAGAIIASFRLRK